MFRQIIDLANSFRVAATNDSLHLDGVVAYNFCADSIEQLAQLAPEKEESPADSPLAPCNSAMVPCAEQIAVMLRKEQQKSMDKFLKAADKIADSFVHGDNNSIIYHRDYVVKILKELVEEN